MDSFAFQNLVGVGTPRPFGGYISESDKTSLSPRFMVKGSKNVYLKKSGALANRPGLKRRGAVDSTSAQVNSSFEWETSLGAIRPLRHANGKISVESDIVTSGTHVWYDLISSTPTRIIFDTWWDNTAKKDILIMCDGTDDLKTWSGAIGLFDSSTTTATVIGLKASAASYGFRSGGGTVIINGTEYTYTGVSGSTLTGAQDATAQADNAVVLDKPATVSNTPAADFDVDFIKVIGNQLYCGSDNSRLVYISKNTDYADFTFSTPRTPGQGELLTLDEVPTGIGVRDGKAHISTKTNWYVPTFSQITVSTTLTERTDVEKVPLSNLKGALRHEFIGNVGNDIVYLSQDQQLMVFGTFRNINQAQFPSLSNDIETELANEDFTGGHLRTVGDLIYLTAPNNGRLWIHETLIRVNALGNIEKERIWHAPFISNISRIAVINGVEYGHSNANPQIYQLWDTLQWHDDSPSEESLPYDCVLALPYWHSRMYDLLAFDKVYWEGYMSPGSDVRGAAVYEYQGDRSVQQVVISTAGGQQPEFFAGDVGSSLGEASLGDNPLGDQTSDVELDQELLPKFRRITDMDELHVFEYQLRVYSSEVDSRWELLRVGTNAMPSGNEPTYLRN